MNDFTFESWKTAKKKVIRLKNKKKKDHVKKIFPTNNEEMYAITVTNK